MASDTNNCNSQMAERWLPTMRAWQLVASWAFLVVVAVMGVSGARLIVVNDPSRASLMEKAASLSLSSGQVGSVGPEVHQLSTLTLAESGVGVAERNETLVNLEQKLEGRNITGNQSNQTPSELLALIRRRSSSELQRQQARQNGNNSSNWSSELNVERTKPSWLNVSRQFKVNGSNEEEVSFMLPVEYMLRPAFDSPVLLQTRLGVIEGVRSIQFNKQLFSFLSVPFAKPPVGDLRFRAPQPIGSWQGIYQASKWPPFCVQPSMTLASKSSPVHALSQFMSEDCLYLNIWTPSLKPVSGGGHQNNSQSHQKLTRRPVMVWLHGGAFQFGGISVDENEGSALALLGDVVVVTVAYRVSAFGFLNANFPGEAPNNVGILDQRMALHWVQDNIKQFGGDPNQVTLFGESAGGHSVGLHLVSPGSYHLFRRAIFQSGVPTSLLRSYDVNHDAGESPMSGEPAAPLMLARRLGCRQVDTDEQPEQPETTETEENPNPNSNQTATTTPEAPTTTQTGSAIEPLLNLETIQCMRTKSSLEILRAEGQPGGAGFFPTGNDPTGVFPNGPIMDSLDPENPKLGPQKDILIGTNADEGTFMLHYALPAVFPAKSEPTVDNMEALKSALMSELQRLTKASNSSGHPSAQSHLFKPLLKTSSSLLESFMSKSPKVATTTSGSNSSTSFGCLSSVSRSDSRQHPLGSAAQFGLNLGRLISDILFLCPSRALARTLAQAGRNVHFYHYNHRSSQSPYHPWMGVSHHDEVEFVFGRPLRLADVYSGADLEMSQQLIKIWSHFAHTGKMLELTPGSSWPKYQVEEAAYVTLGGSQHGQIGQGLHDRFCNVYETVLSVHLMDSR